MEKVVFSWSGGKDCAISLNELRRCKEYEVIGLLTTITSDYDRISMHGVRRIHLEQQAESVGLPLSKLLIPFNCTEEIYEMLMGKEMERLKLEGVTMIAFGDIFLQDLKDYRERT